MNDSTATYTMAVIIIEVGMIGTIGIVGMIGMIGMRRVEETDLRRDLRIIIATLLNKEPRCPRSLG